MCPQKHTERARQPSEGSLKSSFRPPWITHTQVFTNALFRKSLRALFSNSPLHLFIPSPHSSLFSMSEWVRVIRRKKRKEKQRGWIWAEKHPLGLFPFLKELLQISCLIYEGGLRRDTFWHDRQSPSLSAKCGSDRTRGDIPVSIRALGCHKLVNSWRQNQPFHWNQSVVN